MSAQTASPATAAATDTPPVSTGRLFFLDRIRVALTVLVLLHHIAVTYSHIPVWYYFEGADDASVPILDLLIGVNQAFFMGMFFLISGYFVPGSFERKGAKAFLRDRLLRLGVPLVVFYFAINPITSLIGGAEASYWEIIGAGPLWFAEALIAFCLGYVVWRRVAANRTPRPVATGAPLGYRHVGSVVAIIGLVTYAWRIVVPQGTWVPVIDFPSSAFMPQYLGLFIAGVIAVRRGWLSNVRKGLGRVGACVAVVSLLVYLALLVTGTTGGAGPAALVAALAETVFCVGTCLALLSLFRKTARRQGRFGRFLSQHAFVVFIIHAPVVTAVAVLLASVAAPAIVKFAIAGLIAVPLTWAIAYPIRKIPGARRIL